MSTSRQINEEENGYIGREELVSYLRERRNKSYCSFLSLYRSTIINSLSEVPSEDWRDLDSCWSSRFLCEAEVIDQNNFNSLDEKVTLERSNNRLQSFWKGIIKEYKLRQNLSNYVDEKERILKILQDLDDKIQTTNAQITELTNTWNQDEDSLTMYNSPADDYNNEDTMHDSPVDDYIPDEEWRLERRKQKSRADDSNNDDNLIEDSGTTLENVQVHQTHDSGDGDPEIQTKLKALQEKLERTRVEDTDTSQEQGQKEIPQNEIRDDASSGSSGITGGDIQKVTKRKRNTKERPQYNLRNQEKFERTRVEDTDTSQEQGQKEIPQNEIRDDASSGSSGITGGDIQKVTRRKRAIKKGPQYNYNLRNKERVDYNPRLQPLPRLSQSPRSQSPRLRTSHLQPSNLESSLPPQTDFTNDEEEPPRKRRCTKCSIHCPEQ
ncbi:hypothetical protein C1645_828034 [Glomus cerebriforme]|uniref:Uncharacterized protein n=1 Tax=Glomus cerebriforme TaxID=658196 RepID=A0A397ST98_9GLOM|nr:hypothetical protein C1645_828034 [Glomus cerebriforme]